MQCPKCKSENCEVMMLETGRKTTEKGTSGARKIARASMQVMTLGGWGLINGKKKESEITKTAYKKVAMCKACGHDWDMK